MAVEEETVATLTGCRVLVTGACGFIGSHLVERLLEDGAQVRCFVRYTSRGDDGLLVDLSREQRSALEIVRGDLRDEGAVRGAMRDAEYVFHLGALIAIPYSYVHPREVVETNVLGTLNVLEAARSTHPARVVHISTSEVYGSARQVPISETHPLQGQSPYSASKIGADKLAESYWRSFAVPVVTVRPFNTYGPRQSARAVIPTIITQALGADEVHLGTLEPTRDLTYVTDTAHGMVCAALASEKVVGQVINLGVGSEISIGDLAGRILAILGRDLPVTQDNTRLRPAASEVDRLLSDNRLAEELTGWQPTVSLDDGLTRTVEWIRDHLDRFRVGTYEV